MVSKGNQKTQEFSSLQELSLAWKKSTEVELKYNCIYTKYKLYLYQKHNKDVFVAVWQEKKGEKIWSPAVHHSTDMGQKKPGDNINIYISNRLIQ